MKIQLRTRFLVAILSLITASSILCERPVLSKAKLDDWQTNNLSLDAGELPQTHRITAKEIAKLQGAIYKGESQKAIPSNLLSTYYERDRLLRQFLIQRPVIGLNKQQVADLLSDCKGLHPGCKRNAQTKVFQIFDAANFRLEKEKKKEKEKEEEEEEEEDSFSSLCLEVRFFKNRAFAYRIVLEKCFKKTPMDPDTAMTETMKLSYMYRYYFTHFLETLASQIAEKQGIKENDVARECIVAFNVAKNGEITNAEISQSSLNQKFDQIVLELAKKLSGRPGGRVPADLGNSDFHYPVHLQVTDDQE